MRTSIVLTLTIGVFVTALLLKADDWPIWRGPNRDGISVEKGWNPKKISNIAWEKNIGVGFSSIVVQGDRVYAIGNKDKKKDYVYCLDAKSGKEIWSYSYKCSSGGGYAGPRSTPVLANGMLYTFSREGQVYCLDAKTGKKKWEQNVGKLGAKNIQWNYSGSITIEGKLAIINAGDKGIALYVKTGKKKWVSSGQGGYAAPVIFNKGKNIAMFSCKSIKILDIKRGGKIASYPWETKHNVNAADPIIDKNKIFISSGYGKGCALLKLSGSNLKEVWRNTSMRSHFSTPVLFDGYLYGVDGNTGRGSLVCLDIKDGKTKWKEESVKFGSFMIADGKIIYLNERGTLTICKASPSGFSKIASASVLRGAGKCWTVPVLANGRIFARGSNGKMVCLNVK
jgi:outer membrane protein assembly factor BamB